VNRFKFRAFLQEFPFLKEIIGEDYDRLASYYSDGFNIVVRRLTKDYLLSVLRDDYYSSSLGTRAIWHRLYAVLPEQVIPLHYRGKGRHQTQPHPESWTEGETVLEAVSRVETPDAIRYLVDVFTYDDDFDAYRRREVVVYKHEKGVSFSQRIEEAQADAHREVRAESSF